jgi:hypothetical protein
MSTLCPDLFHGLAKLVFAHRSCQITLSQGAADPSDLKTAKNQGEQIQLQASPNLGFHFGAFIVLLPQIQAIFC